VGQQETPENRSKQKAIKKEGNHPKSVSPATKKISVGTTTKQKRLGKKKERCGVHN